MFNNLVNKIDPFRKLPAKLSIDKTDCEIDEQVIDGQLSRRYYITKHNGDIVLLGTELIDPKIEVQQIEKEIINTQEKLETLQIQKEEMATKIDLVSEPVAKELL